MHPTLSDEQRQAIEQSGGQPVQLIDTPTQQVFYLISAEQFQHAQGCLGRVEDIDPSFYEIDDIELTQSK
jgi:GTPase SAR1 family protein